MLDKHFAEPLLKSTTTSHAFLTLCVMGVVTSFPRPLGDMFVKHVLTWSSAGLVWSAVGQNWKLVVFVNATSSSMQVL
jgi:hypothetical protein